MGWARGSRWLTLAVVLAAIALWATGSNTAWGDQLASGTVAITQNPSGPDVVAGATVHDGLTAVTTANRYVAWRIHIPVDGGAFITVQGATAGTTMSNSVSPVGQSGWGGTGGGNPVFQFEANGKTVEQGWNLGGGEGIAGPAGDYYAVSLIGGGTASVGVVTVQVMAPEGTTVEGFTTGPAKEFADADFAAASGDPVFVPTPGRPVSGSITFTASSALWGGFISDNPTGFTQWMGPNGGGTAGPGEGFGWSGAPPGRYWLHLDESSFSPPPSPDTTMAILADVSLP